MFIIEAGKKVYGPFKTAQAAVKWAKKEMAYANWVIRPLIEP